MKQFLLNINDYTNSPIPPLTDEITHVTLAASTAERLMVPDGAKLVVLTSIGATAYIRGSVGSPEEIAAVPATDSSAGTSSAPIADGVPRMFRCADLASISVISDGAPIVVAEWFN